MLDNKLYLPPIGDNPQVSLSHIEYRGEDVLTPNRTFSILEPEPGSGPCEYSCWPCSSSADSPKATWPTNSPRPKSSPPISPRHSPPSCRPTWNSRLTTPSWNGPLNLKPLTLFISVICMARSRTGTSFTARYTRLSSPEAGFNTLSLIFRCWLRTRMSSLTISSASVTHPLCLLLLTWNSLQHLHPMGSTLQPSRPKDGPNIRLYRP